LPFSMRGLPLNTTIFMVFLLKVFCLHTYEKGSCFYFVEKNFRTDGEISQANVESADRVRQEADNTKK
jgi:hypothetical protein